MSSEWRTYSLAQIALNGKEGFVDGPFGSALPASLYQSSGIPVIRGSNLSKGHERFRDDEFVYVSPETSSRLVRANCVADDIVFTKKGTLGQVGIVPRGKYPIYLLSSNQMRLRVDLDLAHPEFVYYYLAQESSILKILRDSEHTGVPKINLAYLREFPIVLPSISIQTEIVLFLRALDDRITLLRETNATLEAIAQTLFKSWFVDFDPVRAKAEGRARQDGERSGQPGMPQTSDVPRPGAEAGAQAQGQPEYMDAATAALFPDSFEESELGLVPKGWVAATMADISTVGIGKTPPRKEQQWFSEDLRDVRWVSIRDMGAAGVYANQTSEYLTSEAVEKFNVRRVPDNTVLMSFKMTIGRVAITDGEMTTNEAIAHFRLEINSSLSAEYIYLHLRQFDFSRLSSTSSIADAVNSKTVREIPILVPSKQVAAAFQDKISTVFARLKKNEQQAQTLTQLRDTLLPRLISGQLRMPEAQEQLEDALA